MNTAARRLFIAANLVGAILITRASVAYFDDEDVHPFVLEKLPLPHEDLWTVALHAHVIAAALGLPACVLLLSRTLIRRAPVAHRWIGRITGVALLLVLVPTGSYLAFFAKGGVPSTAGFLLSAAIVAWCLVKAVAAARAGSFAAHRRFMLHVVAQMSVAVTSRALLVGASFTDVDQELAYVVALWIPVVASALVAERIAQPRRNRDQDRVARLVRPLQPHRLGQPA